MNQIEISNCKAKSLNFEANFEKVLHFHSVRVKIN